MKLTRFPMMEGAEFINQYFKKRCEDRRITFTRGRPSHSNDNCFVEQKNWDVVRKTVGYFRFEEKEALVVLVDKTWAR